MMHRMDTNMDHPAKVNKFLHPCNLITLICFVGLMIVACDNRKVDPPSKTETGESKKMETSLATSAIRQQTPPLDILQPQDFQTATFAMG